MATQLTRCDWANQSQLEQEYHDTVWGVPVHDDKQLFKMLQLEGQQAGLSWLTILKKMDALCEAYDNFDPAILITYDEAKIAELLQNSGIIRNRLKVRAAVRNAKAYFVLREEFGSLKAYLWRYTNGKTIVNSLELQEQTPAHTPLSNEISKDLKKRGFTFVGGTIMYAFMQSIGMVNDHLVSCDFRNAHERGAA
ncbi:MAG: DNA-3-methyladenine glycosylase I [Candidatus Saccharimonadales bacterium]